MNHAIDVQNLSKQFRRYHIDRPWTLQEALQRGLRGVRPAQYFWALRDVSFTVSPGRVVGVIGPNGAGKSTLLRLIGGVGRPDKGTVKLHGRIGALLDLGAGFHPELTGRENVWVSAIISGLTRQEMLQKFDSIVSFSELNEFIDYPLHTYSTGMQMRLAFAIAVHVEPEVLMIDEVLSVGDQSFQRKCLERIARFKANGCTIILVSHDIDVIRDLCDEALFLRAGRLIAHGPADAVTDQYLSEEDASMEQFALASRTATLMPTPD